MDLSTAKKLLKDQNNEELLKIIVKLSNFSEDAEEWLLDYCKKILNCMLLITNP